MPINQGSISKLWVLILRLILKPKEYALKSHARKICFSFSLFDFHRCLKMNANILHIEYLRRRADVDAIGRYAKSVVLQAEKLEGYLKQFESIADPTLLEFCAISKRLYKAIALWSLLPALVAKIKTQSYDKGENMNLLGNACVSSVNEIGRLHREIKDIPNIENSLYKPAVVHYFTRVIVAKSLE